ncbi:hypothetical protein CHISP_0680 [Chitinispirillum alkaliphilum]|nr:hypothetical protein CHISP_0680 [Chitinispirillum alkaliphilum]
MWYLQQIPSYKVIDHYNDICFYLTENEYLNNRPEHHLQGINDIYGYIAFIIQLLDNNIIAAIGIPHGYEKNEKLKRWFNANKAQQSIEDGSIDELIDLDSPALTDELAVEKKPEISLTNPRWEHIDEIKLNNSPNVANLGDNILLKVSVTGLPNGAGMEFFIYDVSGDTPRRIAIVDGKNKNGTGTAEWVIDVAGVDEYSKLQLEFEAKARSKYSEKCDIKIRSFEFVFSF